MTDIDHALAYAGSIRIIAENEAFQLLPDVVELAHGYQALHAEVEALRRLIAQVPLSCDTPRPIPFMKGVSFEDCGRCPSCLLAATRPK